jgi:hypothetical protein
MGPDFLRIIPDDPARESGNLLQRKEIAPTQVEGNERKLRRFSRANQEGTLPGNNSAAKSPQFSKVGNKEADSWGDKLDKISIHQNGAAMLAYSRRFPPSMRQSNPQGLSRQDGLFARKKCLPGKTAHLPPSKLVSNVKRSSFHPTARRAANHTRGL